MAQPTSSPTAGVVATAREDTGVEISVVIPVFNERNNLEPLHQQLQDALRARSYELVFVNDGSSDGSGTVLEQIASRDPEHVVVVELRRNFGQTAAIAAGIDHSRGRWS